MAVPRNRLSNARKNNRRSHHAKKPKVVLKCSGCGEARLPHTACPACGVYGDHNIAKASA
jgi:large subunit ribosomal protein L32